jgi:predicted O-methyltransferase YrrM
MHRLAAVVAAAALAGAGPQEDRAKALEKLLSELEATRGQYYNVPREDGRFLNLLVKAAGARRALEVGTANGYSAVWLALGLEETGGALTTIEIDPRKVREAKENLAKAGLAGRVTFLEGDAHKIVRTLEGPFDFIFIDADMGNDLDYFEALFPKLSPGGVLLRHNAIRYASTMKDYLERVKTHPELDTVILSLTMDDGFAVSYKKRAKK